MFEINGKIYKNDHLRIDFDNDISFYIPIDKSFQYDFHAGDIISEEVYEKLKIDSDLYLCNKKALSYLAIRNRSSFELKSYLKKKKFLEMTIDAVVSRLEKNGYIDDFAFAVCYINSKINRKTVGKNILKRDLFQKGISNDIIKRAVVETGADKPDLEEVFKLAEKKQRSLSGKSNIYSKVYSFLFQRGFDLSDITKVINRLKSLEKDSDLGESYFE